MTIEELKRALNNAIKTHKGKFTSTGEIRIDLMAEDCLTVIESLESQINLMMSPCTDCNHESLTRFEHPCSECCHAAVNYYSRKSQLCAIAKERE